MPMEQARCPECDAPVGGQQHRLVDGVQRANDWDHALDDAQDRMERLNV